MILLSVVGILSQRRGAVLPSHPVVSTPDDEPLIAKVSNPGYLGPQACAPCHSKRVAEFQSTRHFLATCIAEPGRMPVGFASGHGTYSVPDLPLRFEMTESNGEFFQLAWRQTEAGGQKASSTIDFVYGAQGGNDEVYFTWHRDRLFELPMVWIAPENKWGTSPFDRHGSGDFSRDMTIRCVECHNTWFEHAPGSRNQYGRDHFILGVTCEVCHGPGQEHVDFHQKFPEVRDAHAVVRPATLPRERLMDLCAQCHSNALKHRAPAFSYRPGEVLDDYYYSLRTTRPEDDHVANQTTYLRQSRCFQKSETLTCVTCHNPHQPRSVTNAGSASCRECHAPGDCTDRDRLPAAVQDDCVGCHMPERRKIQVYFQTESDKYVSPVKRYEHRIAVYPEARADVLLRWYHVQPDPASADEAARLSKLLGQIHRDESETRQREYRFLAAIDACREALKFDPDSNVQQRLDELIAIQSQIDSNLQDGLWHERERRYDQAILAFQRVLEAKPDHPMAHGKLGTTYAVTGNRELAVKHLQAAAECDHDDPYPTAMLGWLAYLDGRSEEALEFYRQANAVEPYTAKISHQMGLAYAKLERWPEAAERFANAAAIDPTGVSSILALSQALRHQGKLDEALKSGLRAARFTRSQEAEILVNLADCYADLGKWGEAIEATEKALAIAQPHQPQLTAQIRARLAEFQLRRKSGKDRNGG